MRWDGGFHSSLPARANALLHVLEQPADLFALGAGPGLVLGRGTLGLQPPFLDLALTALFSGLLTLSALSCDARGEFRHEAAGGGSVDEAAQIGHRAAAHTIGLQPPGQFVEEHLGLFAALAQQQAGRSTLIRQHPVRKDQVTTTGRQAWRIRFARRALWLLY